MAQIDGAGQQDTDDQNAEALQAALAQRQVTLQGQPQGGSDVPIHQNSDPVSDESEILLLSASYGKRRVPCAPIRAIRGKHFKSEEIEALAGSIRQRGIVQPILVRPVADQPSAYEIVAGERRWRAAQVAHVHEVPVIVVEVDDRTSLEYAIIENVQRADLNPIEEATGYRCLMDEFGYSYADLAQIPGKNRPHVTNMIRLLDLPPEVKDLVVEGRITAGHARARCSRSRIP